jgi:S1-C subfamily serine protease
MLAVGDLKPGERATFTIFRDGASQDLQVRIEARNNEVAAENNKLWPGLYAVPLSDSLRTSLKLDKNAQGLYVAQIIDKSPASVVGLQRGDRITAVNGEAAGDLKTFYKILREKAGKELWFEVVRGDSTLETLKYKR